MLLARGRGAGGNGGKRAKDQGGFCRLCCWCHLHIWPYIERTLEADKSTNYLIKFCIQNKSFRSFSFPCFQTCRKKKQTKNIFGCYYGLELQRKLRGQSHFHRQPDKDASSHAEDKLLTPVDHLFPNIETRSQSILSKAQSCQMVNTLVHYQTV